MTDTPREQPSEEVNQESPPEQTPTAEQTGSPDGGGCCAGADDGRRPCQASDSDSDGDGKQGEGPTWACVRYGRTGELGLFKNRLDEPIPRHAKVIIKSDRGLEIGTHVCAAHARLEYEGKPIKKAGSIRRMAGHDDLSEARHLRDSELRERKFCEQRIKERKLPMTLVDAEHLFGGDRIVFYFMAEGRVDFRSLVKDLAHEYRTRIEMRQIGVRDQARLTADYERCGQFICCRAFLKEFQPISMRMAKDQKATLDPTKISGRCGRLMCCLRYENDTYKELKKNLPRRNSYVLTEHGPGKVLGGDILTQFVKISINGQVQVVPIESILERNLSNERLEELSAESNRSRRSGGGGRSRDRGKGADRNKGGGRDNGGDRSGGGDSQKDSDQDKGPQDRKPDDGDQQKTQQDSGDKTSRSKRRRRRRRSKRKSGSGGSDGDGPAGGDKDDRSAGKQGGGDKSGPGGAKQRGRGGDLGVPKAVLENLGVESEQDSGDNQSQGDKASGGDGGGEPGKRSKRRGKRRRGGRGRTSKNRKGSGDGKSG